MTTMTPISTAGAAPALPEPLSAESDNVCRPGDDPLAVDRTPAGGSNPLTLFGSPHELHPLAQQQQAQAADARANSCQRHDPAAGVYDIGCMSQADIDALKKSRDPAQQRLGQTIDNAKASYGDLLAKGAQIVVTANAGNGGAPVMTMMAPGFGRKVPARIHTHYHGDNATVGDPVGSKAGQNSRIRETWARDPQTVFVLPECTNPFDGRDGKPDPLPDSPTHDKSYHANWGNVQSQASTTDEALRAAGITRVEKQTVSVHSRGGEVIQKLIRDDPSGRSLRADRLELHDSLYGSQGAVAAWGRTANGKQVEKVIYVHGNNPEGRDQEIAKTFKGAYIRIDISHQRPLNDRNDPVVYDGKNAQRDDHIHGPKGHEGVRQFNPDPHYQTTGRFLALWPLPN